LRIAYYMPFKPLGHPNPSGDLIIGSELHDELVRQGHVLQLASRLRSRWIYWKPWQLLGLPAAYALARQRLRFFRPALWLTYHSYYKAPDVLGPLLARRLGIPYIIFQGVYSTRRRRDWRTRPGFLLNRRALYAAQIVFTNKRNDEVNLRRLLPGDRLQYIAPGLRPAMFGFDAQARQRLRRAWGCSEAPVVLSAAMFRPGVKSLGLTRVIEACGRLAARGRQFHLVICGAGEKEAELRRRAETALGKRVIFAGRIPREQMRAYYSAADLFAFPGIQEGLGMVYLEAQACGRPVVAYADWGASEAVVHGATGLLCPSAASGQFDENLERLIVRGDLRDAMGAAARDHIMQHHDLEKNYKRLSEILELAVKNPRP
jgi:glycosyltransferase involved in cell wall biosynthesis